MSRTILLVEDSESEAVHLMKVLKDLGLTNSVIHVSDSAAAVNYLEGRYPYADRARYPLPGIIFLDLSLPETDGFAFLEWLKGQPALGDIFVFAISALDDMNAIRRAYALGARSFLAKPCRPADVEDLMTSFPSRWERTNPRP